MSPWLGSGAGGMLAAVLDVRDFMRTHPVERRVGARCCICGAAHAKPCTYLDRDGRQCSLPVCDQHSTGGCCPEHAKGTTP
jgi:hypothetical protein